MSTSVAAESQALYESPLRVRELDIGAAIDEAVLLLRRHFGLFAKLVLLLIVPFTIPTVLLSGSLAEAPMMIGAPGGPPMMGPALESILILLAVAIAYSLLVQPAIIGLMSHAAARIFTGGTLTLGQALRWLPRHLLSLIVATLMVNLSITFGVMMCIVPGILLSRVSGVLGAAVLAIGTPLGIVLGILLYLIFALTVPVIAVEGVGPIAAISRSIELSRQNRISILGLTLVLGVIGFFLNSVGSIVPEPYTSAVLASFTSGMTTSLQTACLTVFYLSCRCKHEHYDLRLLAEQVAAGRDASTAFGAAPAGEAS